MMIKSKRNQELRELAFSLGMDYREKDDWGIIRLMSEFKLFQRGFDKKIINILSDRDSNDGFVAIVFDYHYKVSTGKTTSVFKQTVFFIESKQLGLPHFWMRPETIFDKVSEWLGFNDIDFDTHPEFSKNYYLKGEDADYIRATMNDDFLHFFSFSKNWYLEGIGYYMILYNKHKLQKPQHIKYLYITGRKLFEFFKIKD